METNLCDHCGETVTYHTDCDSFRNQLQRAVERFKEAHSLCNNVLSMAIHVNYLNGLSPDAIKARRLNKKDAKKDKRDKREKKLKELLKKVSALRNSNSGFILIQLVGLAAEDSFTGAFDELVDQKLNELIEDGSLFGDTFKKRVFYFEDERFLALYVKGTTIVTTIDFQTKIALDSSIVTPSPSTVRKLVQKTGEQEQHCDEFPPIVDDFRNIIENRSLQLKSIIHIQDRLVDRVWEDLKLRECISAFAKNENGGVYILGIEEIDTEFNGKDYVSKKCNIHGMTKSVCEEIQERVLEEAKKSLIIYDYDGNVVECLDPIRVTLKAVSNMGEVQEQHKDNFVLQVAVRHINGIVFYDKDGPLAYTIAEKDGSRIIDKVPYKDWLKLVRG